MNRNNDRIKRIVASAILLFLSGSYGIMNIKFAVGGKNPSAGSRPQLSIRSVRSYYRPQEPAKNRRKRYRGVKVMMGFINYLINGISLGSVYAIIALGYTMVYGIAKMLNFAHGDIIMVGSYTVFITTRYLGMPTFLSVLLAVVVCTLLGIVIERVAYKPLRDASPLSVLITAIGVSYLLQNVALLLFGADTGDQARRRSHHDHRRDDRYDPLLYRHHDRTYRIYQQDKSRSGNARCL